MIKVALLTNEQKEILTGQLYGPDSYFNPFQDLDGNWIISVEEINQCMNINFIWVKDLLLIDYKPNNFEID